MRTPSREPQTLGGAGTLDRIARILAARGIDPTGPVADESGPSAPSEALPAGVPPRYRDAVADHPQVLAWAREVDSQAVAPSAGARRQVTTGPSLLMAGVTGAGKTHQAYGAVRALAETGVGVRWRATTAADLYAELRPRAGVDSEQQLAAVARIPLLMLDDLGAAKASEWVEEVTYRLVNRRYNHMLPTLITTNLAIRDLRTHLGDRVASRLAQMTTRVEFAPVDRRRARVA
ncbi:ATP-binding protein [Actinacidiphila acididurans]|uniref:ATP-binding protein n=1 Tax=Actinacidiphila acididurans TaxID=2784346 RepID=A0ABS2TXF8_9ACTN|nr:ATP-binding protein [Actinacidiphila acididurans]MBM9508035.1 ATP-binding protein [Actinacidiphila acididurans]